MTAAAGARPPLAGARIVVTRARAQARELTAALEALGAEVVELPTIRIVPPADPEPLRRAAEEAAGFDWIVFTSANAVERFAAALAATGGDERRLRSVRVCAVGPATAAALAARGVRADVVPEEFVSDAAAGAMSAVDELRGRRILLPRARAARAALPEALRAAGGVVVEVEAYATELDGRGAEVVRERLAGGEVDVVTFTAGSTVRAFAELVGTAVGRARVATIGPVTSAVARAVGIRVDVEAAEHTIEGLVQVVRELYEG